MGHHDWERVPGPSRRGKGMLVAALVLAAAAVVALGGGEQDAPPETPLEVVTVPTSPPAPPGERRGDPSDPDAGVSTQARPRLSERWRVIPPAPLSARTATSALWGGAALLVWDGTGIARFDPDIGRWESGPAAPEVRTRGWSGVWDGREALYWAGAEADGALSGAGLRYDPIATRWQPIADGPLQPRVGHAAAGFDGGMVVWGGETAAGEPLADGAVYLSDQQRWDALPPAPLAPRRDAHLAVLDLPCPEGACPPAVLVWGGEDAGVAIRDGAIFSPTDASWTSIPDVPVSYTGAPAAVWAPGSCAGEEDSCAGELLVWGRPAAGLHEHWAWAYDPITRTWRQLPGLLGQIRADAEAVWTGEVALVWGGRDWRLREDLNAGFGVDPVSGRWQQVWRSPMGPRLDASVLWAPGTCPGGGACDGSLLVWGGRSEGVAMLDGGLYAWPPVAQVGHRGAAGSPPSG